MKPDTTTLAELSNATQVARETASRRRQEMKALKAALKTTQYPAEKELIRPVLDTAETRARTAADTALRAGVRERAVRNGVTPFPKPQTHENRAGTSPQ